MPNTKKTLPHISILNDLIIINNDRIDMYDKLKELCAGTYLAEFFEETIKQCNYFIIRLRYFIEIKDSSPKSFSPKGKIYQVWTDLRTVYNTNGELSLMAICDYGEDAALKAYEIAIASFPENIDIRIILEKQKYFLEQTLHTVKHLRSVIIPNNAN